MKKVLIYIFLASSIIILNSFTIVDLDNIWAYGFSYNISNGLIPYKDFNMIIGPAYSLINAIPIKLFGNYLYAFIFFDALIYAAIFMFIYNKIGKKCTYLMLLMCICNNPLVNYNIFCSLLLILIIILNDDNKKYSNIIMGVLMGLILMTKHNIGILLSLIYILNSKEKLKSIISMLVIIIPIILYLTLNNALYNYIDLCFLGSNSFISNFNINVFVLIIVLLLDCLLLYKYRFEKDIAILYIILFQIILFPLIDINHMIPAIIPICYYLIYKNNKNFLIIIGTISVIMFIMLRLFDISNTEIIKDNNYLKYLRTDKGINNYIKKYDKYLNKIDKKVYLFINEAYMIKIYRNELPDFYDLINNGNLGTKEDKYINKIGKDCRNKKCTFILDHRYFSNTKMQYSKKFKDYIIKNYYYVETLEHDDKVYTNIK